MGRLSHIIALAPAGVMELVDVADSKSAAGDSVPVRVRSPAPCRSKEGFAPALFCKFSQAEKARRFKPTCFLSCKMTLKLFSADRQSRHRGLRQNRHRGFHRSHRLGLRQNRRRGFHRSHRLGCCRNHRHCRCQSLRRGLCCQSLQTNRPSSRVVSAAGAGGDYRRRSRRCAAVWVRPAEDGGRPNGADAGRAGDGAPRRWGDTSPSERPCRASCSGGDSGDNACRQA